MANLLQSSQTQATQAPSYYTDYLSNIALQGANAAGVGAGAAGLPEGTVPLGAAQYIGSQPLQETAFANVQDAAGAFKPTLTSAENTLGSAVSGTSPLDAASSYLTAAGTNPATAAAGYMSPYTTGVVNQIGNIGQRNIMQNLAPSATAGAVGAGQFGSKRGAEVLGQTIQNSNRDILGQQTSALDKAYQTALDTAIKQNQINAQMGTTAATAASQGQQNLTQAGQAQGTLASTNQALNLADINALATLGEQQRTIKQNEQLFPLSNLSTLSGMLRGYTTPTTTTTTATGSPLSALASLGAGATGLFSGTGTGGSGPSLYDNLVKTFGTKDANGVGTIFPGLDSSYNTEGAVQGGEFGST